MMVEGQTQPGGVRNEGKSAHAPRVTTLVQRRQWQQQHDAGNDASAMQAKRQRNAGKRQHCTGWTFESQLGNNPGTMPATRTAWRWQWRQCNAGKDTSAMPKKGHRCLGQTVKGQIAVGQCRKQQRVHGRQWWAQQWCLTGDVSRLHHDWLDASLWCWQQWGCAKGGNARATRAKMPVRWGQQCRHNACNNNGMMLAMMPARVATASWLGRHQFAMLAVTRRQQGQQCQRNKGKSTYATRAMTPAQHQQQGWKHNAGNDASAMWAKRQCNAGKRQRGTSRTFKDQLSNNAGAMPATRTAWRWQWRQCNVGKDTSATLKKCHHCLDQTVEGQIAVGQRRVQQQGHGQQWWAWQQCLTGDVLRLRHDWLYASSWCWWQQPSKAKSLWAKAGYSNKATGNDDERDNNALPATCCDCVMTGCMPVHDAGGNTGVLRAAMPAQQRWRHPCKKGNDAGTTPATTMVRCWQWCQHVLQLRCDWADASSQCWRQCKDNEGNNASATRAKVPTRWWQWCRCNASNKDNSTMLAMTPAQCGQNASATPANASAAPAGPSKAISATTPVQRRQQGQLEAGNNASAMRARTPAQRQKNAIAASARLLKAKIAVGRCRVQQQGHGGQRWAWQQCLTNNRLWLRHDWADASL
jgi:hypothetical protein